jgi:hypothetical protein
MENLCFIERSLQFSKIARKSLEEFYSSFSSVSSPWRPFFFFPHWRQLHPNPSFLPLSLSSTRQQRGSAQARKRHAGGALARGGAGGVGARDPGGGSARGARAGAARAQARGRAARGLGPRELVVGARGVGDGGWLRLGVARRGRRASAGVREGRRRERALEAGAGVRTRLGVGAGAGAEAAARQAREQARTTRELVRRLGCGAGRRMSERAQEAWSRRRRSVLERWQGALERLGAPFFCWSGRNAALAVVAAANTRCGSGNPAPIGSGRGKSFGRVLGHAEVLTDQLVGDPKP